MKILVVNCGSSSIKYQLFEMPQRVVLGKGFVERIGEAGSALSHTSHGHTERHPAEIATHEQGLELVLRTLTEGPGKLLERIDEIESVGHRVVHGADEFTGSVLITAEVLAAIERVAHLAPLHNPPNLAGIRARSGRCLRRPGGLLRHRVSHDVAAGGLHVRLAAHAVRAVPDSPLRLSRDVAPLRVRASGPTAGRDAGGRQSDYVPSGERLFDGGHSVRPERRHDDGADAAGRPRDGHKDRRSGSRDPVPPGRKRLRHRHPEPHLQYQERADRHLRHVQRLADVK